MDRQITNNQDLYRDFQEPGSDGMTGDLLWISSLNEGGIDGFKFNRKYPICQYIVDFVCLRLNLIIEIDTPKNSLISESGHNKLADLEMLGYVILRFSDQEVVDHLDEVERRIHVTVESLLKNRIVN